MRRGEIWWADLPAPAGRRPVLILTREAAIPVRTAVTVASITRTVYDIPAEVPINQGDGMPTACVINCDNLLTVPKTVLKERICTLSHVKMKAVEQAVKFALDLK